MRCRFLLLLPLLLLSACKAEHRYDARGRVVGFGDDDRTVIVAHEDIPGLMPAMTMPLRADRALPALEYGDAIGFDLVVTRERSWIENVRPVPDSSVAPLEGGRTANAPADALLDVGDAVPPAGLVDDRGRPFTLADYRGKVLVVDFIYTRCPLPDFCLLLSRKFSELHTRFAADSTVQLLSVTLDPDFDTPEVLRAYRARYTDAPEGWRFATGTAAQVEGVWALLGQYVVEDGAELQHNLVTAVIGRDGRVRRYFRGQDWTVEDVSAAIRAARDS